MLCVNTKVLKPKVLNTVLAPDPGATCSLLPGTAESTFLTEIVKYPDPVTSLIPDAITLGTVELIACCKPSAVALLAGTATSVLLTRIVWSTTSAPTNVYCCLSFTIPV